MSQALTNGQQAVLRAFFEFGPMTDTALAVYVHHVSDQNMSSSGIRTRRNELSEKPTPLVHTVGQKKMKSGRHAAIHYLTDGGVVEAKKLFTTV